MRSRDSPVFCLLVCFRIGYGFTHNIGLVVCQHQPLSSPSYKRVPPLNPCTPRRCSVMYVSSLISDTRHQKYISAVGLKYIRVSFLVDINGPSSSVVGPKFMHFKIHA